MSDIWINIIDNSLPVPPQIDGTYPPTHNQLVTMNFRLCDPSTIPDVATGYTRQGGSWVQDQSNPVRGIYQPVDVLTADIEAEQAAAYKAANLERWIWDNVFLMVCNAYFGTYDKRGTADLLKKAFEIVAADQLAGMKAFGVVIAIDKELVRLAGNRWWDSCEWHNDADAIAGAQAALAELGAT